MLWVGPDQRYVLSHYVKTLASHLTTNRIEIGKLILYPMPNSNLIRKPAICNTLSLVDNSLVAMSRTAWHSIKVVNLMYIMEEEHLLSRGINFPLAKIYFKCSPLVTIDFNHFGLQVKKRLVKKFFTSLFFTSLFSIGTKSSNRLG